MPQPIDPSSFRSPDPERPAVPLTIETEPRPHDPLPTSVPLWAISVLFTFGNLLSITGRLMLAVAVEWEIYARTHSATALGLVGLAIAVPVVTLSLPAGHLADRDRVGKHIILVSLRIFQRAKVSLALALVSWKHLSIPPVAPLREGNRTSGSSCRGIRSPTIRCFHFDDASVPLIYLLLFIGASARTFQLGCAQFVFSDLGSAGCVRERGDVEQHHFSNRICCRASSEWTSRCVRRVFVCVFAGCVLLLCVFPSAFFQFVAAKRLRDETALRRTHGKVLSPGCGLCVRQESRSWPRSPWICLLCCWAARPALDADLCRSDPARRTCRVFGWMRAMPAFGAVAGTAWTVAHLPPMKHAGKNLLWCVTGFGVATVLFGLSKTFWLSLGVLCLVGAFDSVSVIIRGSIVQLVTQDEMRGRVSSVNNIFIGTSNEFGALESGLTAALFGPVISVVAGGIGTILVVLGVALRWPETLRIGALDKNLQ